ncbi:MAG TPA: PVC-type heme-binding CxxCH protein [Pirellulales bacterium]|jgi:putative membrane-bound dehydrogenase-like protein|nr:PVC-type heme-binding CxxCH protein [Pirellulales bacterium]
MPFRKSIARGVFLLPGALLTLPVSMIGTVTRRHAYARKSAMSTTDGHCRTSQLWLPISRLLSVLGLLIGLASLAQGQLSPDQELKSLKASPGFEVSLFASEPLITNPAAIDVDTQGRVWVAEIQWYRGGAKNPPADKIKVLEDTDGDGKADKVTVFAEGVFAPMSICVAGERVFVATSPDLWMYEDKNGDLKADGPPKKLLTGFGGHNHDHGAHSLVLGPDHKWWMSHGDAGFNVIGTDGSKITYRWGAILRGELDGGKLETVAVNFRNPYEICISSFGESFASDNDNDGNESVRICWIMEGGNYGWFGGPPFDKQDVSARLSPETPFREHWHFRGFMPGYVPATLVTGFGSPTGICFYESDAFGPKYKNAPLHTDCGPRECRVYRHVPAGAGMKATSEVFLANEGDNYFRPDDICAGPDGRLYVADWYDGGVGGHGYNNPDQGRIFLLLPTGRKLERHEKPGPYANVADAIEGLKSPNLATQFLARERLLAEGERSVAALKSLLSGPEPNDAARALWVLDRIGGDARAVVVDQLKHANASFRALAVRILRRHGSEFGDPILDMADDASAEVRREVLLAIRTLEGEQALATLAQLASTYDGTDRYLLEAINVAAADRKLPLLARLEMKKPLSAAQFLLLELLNPERAVNDLLARLANSDLDEKSRKLLLETAVNMPALDAGWGLLKVAANPAGPARLRRSALEKVIANLNQRGNWAAMAGDDKFIAALRTMLDDKDLLPTALGAIGKLRLTALSGEVLALMESKNLDEGAREQAVAVAARLQPPGIAPALCELLSDPQPKVVKAALRGIVDVQDIRALREILCGDAYPQEIRGGAADRLVDSVGGAILLLRLIDEKQLPANLQSRVVARAVRHADVNIRVLYEKFIPEAERPKKLGKAIRAEDILALAGDANRGRIIFNKSSAAQCKACHAVQGFGGALGPDLSNIGKKYERGALLETILDPSKAIAPEFIPHLLETKSGQVYAGFLLERSADRVMIKDVKNQLIRVEADEVEALVPQQKSLMPELILSEVTAQDAADLLAFLTSLK